MSLLIDAEGRTQSMPAGDGAAGTAGMDSPAPLAQNADFASASINQQLAAVLSPASVRAWYLRAFAREQLKRSGVHKRLRWCGQKVSRTASGVGVVARPDRAYGRLTGICVCGQSLCCPVCAPRIAAFRAEDVKQGFRCASANGFEARLVTYKMPHTINDGLGDLIDVMARAWRLSTSGRVSKDLRKNSFGNITAFEFTWGDKNGWHPHKHQLRFDKPGTFCEHSHRAQWLASLYAVGRYTHHCDENAFDVGVVGDEAGADYISKLSLSVDSQSRSVALEVAAGSAKKKGRNIINLLADAAQGDEDAAAVWLVGVKEIINRKVTSLRWSRGLRDLLGVGPEKDDVDVAAEEVVSTDVYLGQLNMHQWRIVTNNRAELTLCVAANIGIDAVNSFLRGLGAGELIEEPVEPSGRGSGVSDYDFLSSSQGGKAITTASLSLAQWQREIDKPSGLSRQQMAAMKD